MTSLLSSRAQRLPGAKLKGGTELRTLVAAGALAVRLLNRTTRRIALTEEGRAYYERARREFKEAMIKELLPRAMVVTPNIPEAEALTGLTIRSLDDARRRRS